MESSRPIAPSIMVVLSVLYGCAVAFFHPAEKLVTGGALLLAIGWVLTFTVFHGIDHRERDRARYRNNPQGRP